jgi:type I restriction enzyme S subunit
MSGKHQAYPEYKDSGVEWLGEIPKDWFVKKLKYICDVQTGTKDTVNAIDNGRYPFFVRSQTVESINSIGADCEAVLTAGDGVGVGKVFHYYDGKFDYHQRVYMMNNFSQVLGRFFYYYLSNNFYKVALEGNAKSTVDSLRLPQFLNFEFSLPDKDIQKKIVLFLDYETAKIDTLIEKQQQLIQLLKEKRQAVISHAVTKGLNPNAPMRDSGVEWLGEVPEHWEVCKLKHIISSLESGVSVNASDVPAQGDELGVLKTSCVYTRSFRVEENKTVLKEEENRVKCPVRKGAIIISRMNTPELVGASALVETDETNIFLPDRLWQTVFANDGKQNPKFIAFFMMIKGFRNQISLAAEGASSSMQNIAKDDYLSINILLPSIAEQDAIVSHLESKLEGLQKLDERINKAIEFMQERRTALISAAVTGKIDIRGWQAPGSFYNNQEINREDAA